MRPGFGFRLHDSRITRESMTWNNGTLGRYVDVSPEGITNATAIGRLTNLAGSAQERVSLNAGVCAYAFNQPYEQPDVYLSDDTRFFRYGGSGGWSVGLDLASTFAVVADTTGLGYVGQITFPDKAEDGTSGVSLSLNGLDIGRRYTAIVKCSANWTGTASSFVSAGTSGSGTTGASPTYPAVVTANNILILAVVSKYAYCDDAVPIAAGFTLFAQTFTGTGTTGVAAGDVYLKVYVKQATGAETGTLALTGVSLNSIQAQFAQYSGSAHDLEVLVDPVAEASPNWLATYPGVPDVQTNDRVVIITGVNTGTPTINAFSLTDAGGGTTFSAGTQRFGSGQFSGDDTALYIHDHTATGFATGQISHSITFSGNTPSGASIYLRIRNNGAVKIATDSPFQEEPIGYRSKTMSPNSWESIGVSFVATGPKHQVYIANKASTVTGNIAKFTDLDIYTEGWGTGAPNTPAHSDFGAPQALASTANVPYPTVTASGQVAALFMASVDGQLVTPAGWIPVVGPFPATGFTSVAVYKQAMTGTEGGTNQAVAATGSTKGVAWIQTFTPTGTAAIDIVSAFFGFDGDASSTAYSAPTVNAVIRRGDRVAAYTAQQGGTFSGNDTGVSLTCVNGTLGTTTQRTVGRTGTNTVYYNMTDADVRGGSDQAAVTFAGTGVGANASGITAYVVVREAVSNTSVGLLHAIAPDPVMRAYKALVHPEDFWSQSNSSPRHIFKAGGLPSGFTTFGENPKPARLDGEFVGITQIDDTDLPSIEASDVLGPRSRREQAFNLAMPHRQIGSAFHNYPYQAAGPGSPGTFYRGYQTRSPVFVPPLYMSFYIKTTFTSFNFVGSYLKRALSQINGSSGDFMAITLGNSAEAAATAPGQICGSITSFGTEYGKQYATGITISDGKWHHVFVHQIDSQHFNVYVDGAVKTGSFFQSSYSGNLASTNPLTAMSVGSVNYFNGCDSEIYGLAMGDAGAVTYDRIKFLAAARLLPDFGVATIGSNLISFVDDSTWVYINDGIQFVNSVVSTNPNNNTNTSLNVTLASTTPGHTNYIHFQPTGATASTDPGPVTPQGWTLLGYAWGGSSTPTGTAIYARQYKPGDPGVVNITWTNTPAQAHAITNAYSGVDPLNLATDVTVQNQVASSATKTTAVITPMSGSGWLCLGYADRTGTSDYTSVQETTRNFHRNSSSINMVSADTNRLIVPNPNSVGGYSATGPVTSVGQNWIYRLQPANDAQWIPAPGRIEGYSGSRWVPGVKAYSVSNGWERAN